MAILWLMANVLMPFFDEKQCVTGSINKNDQVLVQLGYVGKILCLLRSNLAA